MHKKFLTLIVIPHDKGRQKSFTLSVKAIRIAAGIAVFLCASLVIFLLDYFAINITGRQKYNNLLKESDKQKETIAQYEDYIEGVKATIDNYEKYAKKLNVLAGLKSSDVMDEEPGVGGGAGLNQESSASFDPPDGELSSLQNISQQAEGIEKNLNVLTNFFEDESLKLAGTPTIWPTKGYLSSPYGWRNDPFTGKRTFHAAIDIATYQGNPVVSTADGVVINAGKDKLSGNYVKISHRGGLVTVYCHLSKILVKRGQRVKRWDKIGLVGATGKARGPHVHYEVHLFGKQKNPWYYLLEE